jgi:2-dehydro-3-deoxyphosphogluconate aldolase / (4S)-4-hydroxy-2-oxoglutarate aldolase
MSPLPQQTVSGLMAGHPKLVPVLHVEHAKHAEPLLETLVGAGIMIIEVTLRSACALEVIARMVAMRTPAVIGAGTVTRTEQVAQAVDVGAMFGVSPALTPHLAKVIRDARLPFLPGVCTPSEALMAREAGFSELKFFPADLMGGVGWLNHIYPLYPDLGFCPTGGISDANSRDYLALPNVLAVGGAFLAPRSLIESADWRAISEQASRSVELVRS